MTTAIVSSPVQTLPPFSTAMLDSPSLEDKGANSPNASAALTKDSQPISGDTVSISDQSRQVVVDAKKEEAAKEKTTAINNRIKPVTVATTATVQFVYDLNGGLIVRHMDSDNRLIYQVPSKLMLRMKELASKSNSSVDTKA